MPPPLLPSPTLLTSLPPGWLKSYLENGEGTGVIQLSDVQPRRTGGRYNVFIHDGMYFAWQTRALIK